MYDTIAYGVWSYVLRLAQRQRQVQITLQTPSKRGYPSVVFLQRITLPSAGFFTFRFTFIQTSCIITTVSRKKERKCGMILATLR